MKRYIVLGVLFWTSILGAKAQWSIHTTLGLAYSGLSQSVRAEYRVGDFYLALGPSINMSKHNYPWSGAPGISFLSYYDLNPDKTGGQVFAMCQLTPLKYSNISEMYVGYGINISLKNRWRILANAGFGGYQDKSKDNVPAFKVGGLGYCTHVGIAYSFGKNYKSYN